VSVLHFVDSSNRLVITLCSGEVSRTEVVASLTELRQHPDFRPDFCQLVDLSQVSRLDLYFADMNTIHRAHDPFSNEGRRAVIAPGSGATFGLARMYQSIVDSAHFEVFQSSLDAIAWLGLDVTTQHAACKRKMAADSESPPQEGMVLDVPRDIQTSFRTLGKRGKGSGG
jgi:hypothetical protein